MSSLVSTVFRAAYWSFLGMALFVLLFSYVLNWTAALEQPYSIEYEGHVLWAVHQMAQGRNIYDPASLSAEPWAVVIYNPLLICLGALLSRLFGTAFWELRLISMVSAAAAAGGLYMLSRLSGVRVSLALTGVAFFSGFLVVAYWSYLARVDFLGLACGIWATERFLATWKERAAIRSDSIEGYRWAMILLLLAYFTKQQYFVFGVAWLVFLVWNGRGKIALKLGAVTLGVGAAVTLFIQLVTGGYLQHLLFATGLPWEWATLRYPLQVMSRDPKTVVGLCIVLLGLLYTGRLSEPERLPMLVMFLSLLFSLYTMGLRGAYHNHLLVTICGFTWWLTLALERLPVWVAALAAATVLVSITQPEISARRIWEAIRESANTGFWITHVQRSYPRRAHLLAEDPSIAVLAGLEPAAVDVTTLMNIWRSQPGKLDPLIGEIENGKYPAIIVIAYDCRYRRGGIWPPPVMRAILKHYVYVGRVHGNGIPQWIFFPAEQGSLRANDSGWHPDVH
ncbi:MAG TPA: glycosyltransferase family 39 protein [Candidatus Obscuribacterales bacterium]